MIKRKRKDNKTENEYKRTKEKIDSFKVEEKMKKIRKKGGKEKEYDVDEYYEEVKMNMDDNAKRVLTR